MEGLFTYECFYEIVDTYKGNRANYDETIKRQWKYMGRRGLTNYTVLNNLTEEDWESLYDKDNKLTKGTIMRIKIHLSSHNAHVSTPTSSGKWQRVCRRRQRRSMKLKS